MKKILIISDMHSGITRESKTRPGYTRQPSSQALKTLEAYRDKWHTDSFEHLIELGDMTKPIPESHDNVQLYRDAVNTIKSLGLPTTFVFGNHDIEYLSKAEIKEITDQSSFNSVTQIGGFQIVTFEHSQLDKDTAQILRETMDWFEENVKKD
ncbi:MAG: metallophosphoesterase, partial [bacterium]